MNKIFPLMMIFVLFFCKSPSQENKSISRNSQIIAIMQTSFNEKDELKFLDNFPDNFNKFKNTFGWNDIDDAPEPLYKEANEYIDYFFSLISKQKYFKFENKIIQISKDAKWEADAINHFRQQSLNYIKNNKKYNLINNLNISEAEGVLDFFLNPSHSNYDKDFILNLAENKQEIAKRIVSENVSSETKRSTFSTYENNEDYFIKTFDVNNDGINDKIVCSIPYQGESLFVFYGNKDKKYKLNLETTNFSEDGGNIIQDITPIPNSQGLILKTYFPDRGYYEVVYYLIPENNTWILKNTIYKTMSDVSENAVKYICDVAQNIDITKSGWKDKISSIPVENERSRKCRVEHSSNSVQNHKVQDPDGYTNLRKEKNSTSEILQKVKSGENIEVLGKSGDWFLVKTKEGKEGYIHKSRIKSK